MLFCLHFTREGVRSGNARSKELWRQSLKLKPGKLNFFNTTQPLTLRQLLEDSSQSLTHYY